jgi:hypothetical protein
MFVICNITLGVIAIDNNNSDKIKKICTLTLCVIAIDNNNFDKIIKKITKSNPR